MCTFYWIAHNSPTPPKRLLWLTQLDPPRHRINNQPEVRLPWNVVPFLLCACPRIRNRYAILTPSWQVPPALLTLNRHLPVTKADVLLTFCTKIRKSRRSKLPGELARMACWYWWHRWRRWGARGDMREDINFNGADRESDFWLISILWPRSQLI